MTPIKRILRVDEVAEYLQVSCRTVYRLIDEGFLEAFRVSTGNSALRVTAEALTAYEDRQKSALVPENCDNC